MILAIDGEAGAGKTTVASGTAERLGWPLLESGSLYRAIGLQALQTETDLSDPEALIAMADSAELTIDCRTGGNRVTIDGTDVTSRLRDEEVGTAASVVAGIRRIREILLPIQRNAGRKKDLVAEGRDMGSVVFPDAEYKFFLKASLAVRAERRRLQLDISGKKPVLQTVKVDMERRDEQDAGRKLSPMRPADDAVIIDTSESGAETVIETILRHMGKLS